MASAGGSERGRATARQRIPSVFSSLSTAQPRALVSASSWSSRSRSGMVFGVSRGWWPPWMIFTAAVSLVAFLFSAEARDIDITESDPVQGRIVGAANVKEASPLRA
jgi:hypothetical protein